MQVYKNDPKVYPSTVMNKVQRSNILWIQTLQCKKRSCFVIPMKNHDKKCRDKKYSKTCT